MKNYFTKEQLERLSVAEHHFYTAVKENFKRGTMREMNEMLADIYEQATGEQLNRNWNCSHCCLNNFKRIGEWYFKSKEHLEQEQAEAAEKGELEAPELEGVQEMVEKTMEILDLNPDGTEKVVTETVEMETEPAPAKAAPKKKVAKSNTKSKTKKNKN